MTPKGWETLPGWVQATLVERGYGGAASEKIAEVAWVPPRHVHVKMKPTVEVLDVTIAKGA